MSLDSETSGSAREWFFPSPSFLRSSSSQYGRRFYSNSKPHSPPSSSTRIRHRRRVKFPRTPTNDKSQLSDTENVKSSATARNNLICLSQFRFQFALVVGTRLLFYRALSLSLSLSLSHRFLFYVGADVDYCFFVAAAPKHASRKPSH